MSTRKKWIIAAAILLGAGILICGIAFAALGGVIKLSDYQEKIEQYRYYGFRI